MQRLQSYSCRHRSCVVSDKSCVRYRIAINSFALAVRRVLPNLLLGSRSATTSIRNVLLHADIGSSPTCRVSPCLVSIDHVVRNALHFNGGSATTSSNDSVAVCGLRSAICRYIFIIRKALQLCRASAIVHCLVSILPCSIQKRGAFQCAARRAADFALYRY